MYLPLQKDARESQHSEAGFFFQEALEHKTTVKGSQDETEVM